MVLLTQKAYARRRRITPQYVNKLVRQERIVLKRGLVDPAQADRARKPIHAMAGRPRKKMRGHNAHGGGRPARDPGASHKPNGSPSATRSLTAERTRDAGAQASLRELELKERTQELLPAAEVLEAERRKNSNIRLRFRGMARTLAPVMARTAAAADCERLLLEEIDHQLEDLARDPLVLVGPVAPPAPPPAVVQTSAEVGV